jgi:hypothetical protein
MPALLLALITVLVLAGCHTAAPRVVSDDELQVAVDHLRRPLPGDLAALYALQVPASGGLRLSILTAGGEGRMTVSEPFGAAVSVTAWVADGRAEVYDLREGCRFAVDDVASVFGVGQLSLPRAVRLLGGRLPTAEGDRVRLIGGLRVMVDGGGWSCIVAVRPDPWRVVTVTPTDATSDGAWRVELEEHTSSVPGHLRLERDDGRWAELRLVRLEWGAETRLPAVPHLEPCADGGGGQ